MAEVVARDRSRPLPQRPVVHKHVQVREYVRGLLAGAEPGSPAPSERDLVQRFKVARMTVRQALDALVVEGLLERVPGRGTFVAQSTAGERASLSSFTEEMRRRGLEPSSVTLVARLEAAGPGVARALEISEGERVLHWQRLRSADGEPMCLEDAFLADSMVPGFLDQPLPDSLYAELRRRDLLPTWGEDSVESVLPQEDQAELLGVTGADPVLRVSRRSFAHGLVVEVSRSTYRADRFTLWVRLSRAGSRPTAP